MKDVLAEIDKRAAVIEKTVVDAQQSLLATMTSIINETVVPKKQEFGEQAAMAFLQTLMKDPNKANQAMQAMMPLIELGNKMRRERP